MKQKSEGPDYYQRGNIEVWDFIRDQSLNYHLGNVIKYVCRAGYKDNDLKDLKKAAHYLLNEIENRTKSRLLGLVEFSNGLIIQLIVYP